MKRLIPFALLATVLAVSCNNAKAPEAQVSEEDFAAALGIPECVVTTPPDSLHLDPWYKKYVDVNGIPLCSSWRVPDSAFVAAHKTLWAMTSMLSPEIMDAMRKVGTRVTSIYEHDVRLLRQECPDISLITCHDETLCVTWFTGMDGALIGFAGCVPELICGAWEVFRNPDKHTLKEAQDWSNRIYHISQAIYGGGQPSGEAHARLKEALVQRGIFKSGLMRRPVLPLNQEEKDWISLGLERSQLPKVDMEQFKK